MSDPPTDDTTNADGNANADDTTNADDTANADGDANLGDTAEQREPIPGGVVSKNADPLQILAMNWVIRVLLTLGALGVLVPGRVGEVFAIAAVTLLVITPLMRVTWLAGGWARERDRRFVVLAIALLSVAGTGAMLSLMGVGN